MLVDTQQIAQYSASPSSEALVNIEVDKIIGAWTVKASFLSGYEGIDWGVWCFNQDHTLMMGSSLDTRGCGEWRQNSDGSYAFSLIEQLFFNGVWAMSINIYAPQMIIDDGANSFSIPVDNPIEGTMHDPSGNVIGQSTIVLVATRIQLGAANTLPTQGDS